MNTRLLLTSILFSLLAFPIWAQIEDKGGVVAKKAELKQIQSGFGFTEGPAVNRFGDVFFTDQPNNRIYKWTEITGEIDVFKEPSGRANGMYFKLDGSLLVCADSLNQLVEIGTDGSEKVLIENFRGKKLNGPNDLWIRPKGGLFFTDPLYKRPYWEGARSMDKEQDGEHVYYLSGDGSEFFQVTDDLVRPNGIVGTPDGKYLYVADIGASKTFRYEIREDGYLVNKKLFCEMGSDGMTLDHRGNLYLTGEGVHIFNPKGEKIATIAVPEKWTANVVFGGLTRKTLFITASESVYTLQMRNRGVW